MVKTILVVDDDPGVTHTVKYGLESLGSDYIRENQTWKNIPIVFLSARTDKVAKDAGGFLAESYLEKPCKITDLKKTIDDILKQ